MSFSGSSSVRLFTGIAVSALVASAMPAAAQQRTVSLPAMPLGEALQRIAAETGETVNIDPDAVRGLTSRPVVDARNAEDAVRQATRGLPISRAQADDGGATVNSDVVVTAQRDEAETSVLVRGATTSSRLGQSLRDQARNTQVLSSRLLEQQQARTLSEALSNAGGVTVNQAAIQNGTTYSIRGFSSNGSVNGLPTPSNSLFAAGTSQPIANIERIEVLKGPDAILLGGDNLGGTVNIVTKKPSADERLYVSAETGSFGQVRGTLDANRAISADNRLSARVIAVAASADRNFGGYRGNEDYLFAPSLRFKNENTDAVVSLSASNQIIGTPPFAILNSSTKQLYALPRDKPIIGPKNQFFRLGSTQVNVDVTQTVTDWLTLVLRGQHQDMSFGLTQYSPYAVLDPSGLLLISSLGMRQTAKVDAVDGYLRMAFTTGGLSHKIVAGHSRIDSFTATDNAQNGDFAPYDLLTGQPPLPPLGSVFAFGDSLDAQRRAYYGQYLLGFGPIHLMAGVRRNDLTLAATFGTRPGSVSESSATTPNYGAVVDVTEKFSVYGSLAYGFQPTFVLDRNNARLPDVRTRNAETGIKWDLFNDRMLLNASWFVIRESNRIVTDPANPRFQLALPGQEGRGIDINLSGEPIRGLSIVAAFTRTKYRFLRPVPTLGNTVNGVPRDVYSLYGSYKRDLSTLITAGLGAGVSGRSRSAIDLLGNFYVPGAVQADLNAFLTVGKLDINLGIRNLFDRDNLGPTITNSYVPLGEPRNWRLTVGYKFK